MMKIITALTLVGAIVASTFAYAATINVSADQLGAGDSNVTECTENASVAWSTEYSPTATSIGGFLAKDVTVKTSPPTAGMCTGKNIKVVVTDGAHNEISSAKGTIGPNDTFQSDLATKVLANNVKDVHILITQSPIP